MDSKTAELPPILIRIKKIIFQYTQNIALNPKVLVVFFGKTPGKSEKPENGFCL